MKKTLIAAAVFAAGLPLLSLADELEQITVTASRVETPKSQLGVSIAVLTGEDLARMGYTGLLDALATLPGVATAAKGGVGQQNSLFLRGESNFRTLVLVDGVDISDPTNTQVGAQLQHLQTDDIERVEVMRGPQGMMYGAGAGGVINITTKRAEEPLELDLGAEGGRYGTQKGSAVLRGSLGDFDYGLSVSDFTTDGFNATEADVTGEKDGYENRRYNASLGYQLTPELSLQGRFGRTDADVHYDGFGEREVYTQDTARLAADYRSEKWQHKLSLAKQQLTRELPNYSFVSEGEVQELGYVGSVHVGAGKLVWGSDWEQMEFDNGFSAEEVDSLGLFAEWQSSIADTVYYNLGLRRDDLEESSHTSWRASAAYPVLLGEDQQLKYRASYGTGFRAPSPYELSTNSFPGLPQLEPELSRGYELGLEYQLAQQLRAELVYFDQEITDLIDYDFSFWSYYQIDGDSQSEGIELSLAGQLSAGLEWNFSGTWLDTETPDGEQRQQVPQRVYNLGLSYSLLGDSLKLSGNWRRVEDRLDFSGAMLDDYSKLDLNAGYRLTEKLRLTLRGENVLDEDYREVAGYYTAGAAVYAGVQLTL